MSASSSRRRPGVQARFEAALRVAAADPRVPGAIAAVHSPSLGIDWRGAADGFASAGAAPLSPDTPFRIASITKIYVAAAVMRLVEQEVVDLYAPIAGLASPEIADRLREGGYDPVRITLLHLLSHTSGLRDHAQTPDYIEQFLSGADRRWTRLEQVGMAMEAGPQLAAPGEAFSYSDTGYIILGDILERLTGEDRGAALRRLLDYRSLGLVETWWESLEPPPSHAPARARQFAMEMEATDFNPSFDTYGGGGLVSTVSDMIRFVRPLIFGQVFEKPGTLAAAFMTPHVPRPADLYMHSRVFMQTPMGPRAGWGHAGFWGCVAAICPEQDLAIAATINQPRPETPDLLKRLVANLTRAALALD